MLGLTIGPTEAFWSTFRRVTAKKGQRNKIGNAVYHLSPSMRVVRRMATTSAFNTGDETVRSGSVKCGMDSGQDNLPDPALPLLQDFGGAKRAGYLSRVKSYSGRFHLPSRMAKLRFPRRYETRLETPRHILYALGIVSHFWGFSHQQKCIDLTIQDLSPKEAQSKKNPPTSPKTTKTERRWQSQKAVSAWYCLANREKVLAAGRLATRERPAHVTDRAQPIPVEPQAVDNAAHHPAPRTTTRAAMLQEWAANFVAKRQPTAAAAPTDVMANCHRHPSCSPSPLLPSPFPEEYNAGTEADDERDY
ncbi:hypothetical protein K438DRAFT_1757178 [Mycena galopus ATCC 62051]|nr:hypothetical protein K438DRAFT_1757178 [Mycena galopus ATCC 62051]